MARNEKPIDWNYVDKLLEAGCLGTEIAPHFDLHPDTFYRKCEKEHNIGFTEYRAQKVQKGDSLLRAAQFKNALSGNTSMQIWLGKQRLDQRDKTDNLNHGQVVYIQERDPTERDDNGNTT